MQDPVRILQPGPHRGPQGRVFRILGTEARVSFGPHYAVITFRLDELETLHDE